MSEGPRSVGMVTAGWWPKVGGIETHARQLAQWLQGRGVRVEVLCLDDDPDAAPFAEHESDDGGIRVRRISYCYHDHQSLADLGYRIDLSQADSYSNVFSSPARSVTPPRPVLDLGDDVRRGPIVVIDQKGRIIRVRE